MIQYTNDVRSAMSRIRTLMIFIGLMALIPAKAEKFYENQFCYNTISSTEVEVSNAFSPPGHMDYVYNPNDPYVMGFWHNRETVEIPEKVIHDGQEYTVVGVGYGAFDGCTMMKSISLPQTVRYIDGNAFTICTHLKSIDIPESVSRVGSAAFRYCQELESVDIPDNCQEIGGQAFSDCLNLEYVRIGSGVKSIGDYSFTNCKALKYIIFSDSPEPLQLGLGATDNKIVNGEQYPIVGLFWDSPVNYLYMGRDLEYLSSKRAYCPFNQLTRVEFGNMLQNIPDKLFYQTNTTIPAIPEGVKTIGEYAFWGSFPEGKMFKLPSTIRSIAGGAFYDTDFFECAAPTPPSIVNGASFAGSGRKTVFVPDGSGNLYRSSTEWRGISIIDNADELVTINVKNAGTLLSRLSAKGYDLDTVYRLKLTGNLDEDDISNIKEMCNLHYIDLGGLNISDIPDHMFENTLLTKIIFPNNLQSIGASAFRNKCFGGDLNIPSTCTYIGSYAFASTLIKSLNISSRVCTIGDDAFLLCSNLNELTLEGEDIRIGDSAFAHNNFSKITLGEGITINVGAFYYCKIDELNICEGIESIAAMAFEGVELEQVILPSTIRTIGESAFERSKLHRVEFKNGCETLGNQVFAYCENLEEVILPNTLETIPESAFYFCSNLKEIQIPEYCSIISDNAFSYCPIETLELPSSLSSIGANAFTYCALKSVRVPWLYPIDISEDAFLRQYDSQSIILYVPVGTSMLYKKASGWQRFYRFRESARLSVKFSGEDYGSVSVDDTEITGSSLSEELEPYDSLTMSFIPNNGCSIEYLSINGIEEYIDGKYVGEKLSDYTLYVDEVEIDYNIEVKFCPTDQLPIYLYDGNNERVTIRGMENALTTETESPNALFFTSFDNDSHVNYVYDDIAINIRLTDESEFFSPKDFSAENLIYSRTFKNTNWQALYIPFNLSYSEWTDYVDIAEVSNVRGYDENNDGIIDRTVLEFNKVTSGELQPNTPYVIRAKSQGTVNFVCKDKILSATPLSEGTIKCSSTKYNYLMKGIFQNKYDVYETGAYALSGGLFCPASSPSVVLKPFRFYLMVEPKTGGYNNTDMRMKLPAYIEIVVDGESSGVYDINDDVINDLKDIIYDLSGRQVHEPVKHGIIIKKGVKQFIK